MTIDEGLAIIERRVREKARKRDIEIATLDWRPVGNEPRYKLQISTASGRIGDRDFTAKHLTELDSDDQTMYQVAAKIESIMLQLTPE